MAEYTPNFLPGADTTWVAGGTILAGQVVHITATGRTVNVTGAASDHVVGVAKFDALTGGRVTVTRGGEQRLVANGAITAGTPVKSAAAGKVAPWVTGTDLPSLIVGVGINTTTADGDLIDVTWRA